MVDRTARRQTIGLSLIVWVIGFAGVQMASAQNHTSNSQPASPEPATHRFSPEPEPTWKVAPRSRLDPSPPSTLRPDRYFEFDPQHEVITLRARDVPRRELIEVITRRCRIELVDEAQIEDTVSLDLQAVPVVDAIRRVLRGQPFVLRYVPRQARFAARREHQGSIPASILWLLPHKPAHHASLSETSPQSRSSADRARFFSLVEDLGLSESPEVIAATALGDTDPALRQEAIHRLGELGDPASRTVLEQALVDSDRQVREAAIDALTQIGDGQAAWSLSVALDDDDPALRRDAVHALGEIGDEIAIGLLRRALVDQAASVRDAATEVLAEVDHAPGSPD